MQERDLLLRWLRAFFEGLNKLLNNPSVDKKEIQEIYSSFFGKNRANFFKPEAIIMIEELFSECDDITKKEKLSALCQLMELDLTVEQDSELRSILENHIKSINNLLLKKYGFYKVSF
ncbi:hypothetical protein [Mongoliitalea daihaiensis]|uniref:hypothetical protein n=1 Tax=Mongoliitalea daihaiensis TaxID=2782006 RepID=UPI001F47D846|nr:hypothetical protein [Mongoliitalea daihaiensis]UJP66765.1 hypothetical protein IPZ59_09340 [Mongoliitalea daihaiensis]